jgi:hypothetical protein
MKRILLSLFFLLCTSANAAVFQTGKIVGYIPSDISGKEVFLLQIEGNVTGGCNVTGRFAIDSTQLKFKATRAAIIVAFHTQTALTVAYEQTCNSYPNAWDISWVCVGPLPC